MAQQINHPSFKALTETEINLLLSDEELFRQLREEHLAMKDIEKEIKDELLVPYTLELDDIFGFEYE